MNIIHGYIKEKIPCFWLWLCISITQTCAERCALQMYRTSLMFWCTFEGQLGSITFIAILILYLKAVFL